MTYVLDHVLYFLDFRQSLTSAPMRCQSYDSAPFLSTASVSNARQFINLPCCKHESGSSIRKRTLEGATSRHLH